MSFGGYHPFPRRLGGGGKPLTQIIHEALNAQMGTAFDTSETSAVYWQNFAIARALVCDGINTNQRLAYIWDPWRMGRELLPRWEKIFGIRHPPSVTEYDRRKALASRFRRFKERAALHSQLTAMLARELPDVFVKIEYVPPNLAVIHVPDGTYPWGTVASGYPWYSTVAHVLILLQKPDGWTEQEFYREAAKVAPLIDGVLPATQTFTWYRKPSIGAPIAVPNGPSQAGFYLDNPHNLDNSVFAH